MAALQMGSLPTRVMNVGLLLDPGEGPRNLSPAE